VPSRDRRALDAAEPVDLGVGLPRSRPRDRVGRRERVAGVPGTPPRRAGSTGDEQGGFAVLAAEQVANDRRRALASVVADALGPYSRATPSWKPPSSALRLRALATNSRSACSRNSDGAQQTARPPASSAGTITSAYARSGPEKRVRYRRSSSNRSPTVTNASASAAATARLDDRGEIGAERETIARIGVVAPVVHGSGSGTASSACTSSTSSCAGSSRSSLKSRTLIGSVGAPLMRLSMITSRSRARDIPT